MRECPSCSRSFPDETIHCPDDGSATSFQFHPGTVFAGRYRIDEPLGRGGLGRIFKASDIRQDMEWVIELYEPAPGAENPSFVRELFHEGRMAARLNHPNIITLGDFGEVDGAPFFVTEYIDGESLQDLIRREGALEPSRALLIAEGVAAGLREIHRHRSAHRDLQPRHILLRKGEVFEWAKIRWVGLPGGEPGRLMETSSYIAPEQAMGERPDARANIYSLGVILYEMLSGRVPFSAEDSPELIRKISTEAPPPFSSIGVHVPPRIEAAIMHALEKTRMIVRRRLKIS